VLSFTSWPQRFPLWFPLILLSRDVLTSLGVALVQYINGTVRIRPHWTGKVATGAQITALLWVMLDIRTPSAIWSAGVAAVFTFASGMFNLASGIQQLQSNPHA
jgi:CDP-diacylglycerol--glycerol-3-phosphate 3-phosphatidyltransferase/cardiolipin synthase